MKKTFICTLAALILTFAFAVPALAESSPVYGAGTCRIGFTTSRSLDRGSSWGENIYVYNYYVIYDDTWDDRFYQWTYALHGQEHLSTAQRVETGIYYVNGAVPVYSNASTNRNDYNPTRSTLELDQPRADGFSTLQLRITKPTEVSPLTWMPFDNMKTWGWFTKAN